MLSSCCFLSCPFFASALVSGWIIQFVPSFFVAFWHAPAHIFVLTVNYFFSVTGNTEENTPDFTQGCVDVESQYCQTLSDQYACCPSCQDQIYTYLDCFVAPGVAVICPDAACDGIPINSSSGAGQNDGTAAGSTTTEVSNNSGSTGSESSSSTTAFLGKCMDTGLQFGQCMEENQCDINCGKCTKYSRKKGVLLLL